MCDGTRSMKLFRDLSDNVIGNDVIGHDVIGDPVSPANNSGDPYDVENCWAIYAQIKSYVQMRIAGF